MIVAVLSIGNKLPSKYDYGFNRRVTLENLDSQSPHYVYLNLTEAQLTRQQMDEWLEAVQPGNVLEVSVAKDSRLVNKFGQFKLIRKVKENELNSTTKTK